MKTKKSIVALALAAMLGLGACGNAATQQPAETDTQAEAQTEIESQDAASTEISIESQTIGLTGVGNARQLGGYVGADGRKVKDGVLLRSAALGSATDEDVKKLTEVYHLAEVIDLRTTNEIEAAPDLDIDGVKNVNLRILDEAALMKAVESQDPEVMALMQSEKMEDKLEAAIKIGLVGDQMYITFLSHDAGKQGYAQMFKDLLALPEGQSLLFHCTQGKDRTGCAALLILSALGVDEDTIMADYLLTNEFNAELIAQERQDMLDSGVAEDQLDHYMIARDQVFPQTMANGLAWLKENYGSTMGYIKQELGITDEEIAELQAKFLD